MRDFDFPYTCPKIDSAIRTCSSRVSKVLDGLDLASEVFDRVQDQIMEGFIEHFEEVRSLNEDMRAAAVDQLAEKQDEIRSLADDLETAREEIRDLNREADDLFRKVESLEGMLAE